MQSGYIIEAYSPSLNESHRWFNLHDLDVVTDESKAKLYAEAFAIRLNREQKNYATDWIGRYSWQDMGIETIPGYIAPRQ